MLDLLFILLLIINGDSLSVSKQRLDKNNYRAALYSTEIDFTKGALISPEIQYSNPDLKVTSYKYFIEYGNDTQIEIIEPGYEIKAFTAYIKKLEFSKKKSTLIAYKDQSRNYYIKQDSITYDINESRGRVKSLCNNLNKSVDICDTVSFFLNSTKKDYEIVLVNTISNLRSIQLFYPDIKFLPYKIIEIGQNKSVLTLEKVIYGKASVDSLLNMYNYEGYKMITDDDFTPSDLKFTIDLIEKMKRL